MHARGSVSYRFLSVVVTSIILERVELSQYRYTCVGNVGLFWQSVGGATQ